MLTVGSPPLGRSGTVGATNFILNPSFEVDTTNWSTAQDSNMGLNTAGTTLTRITSDSFSGSACCQAAFT